MSEPVQDAIDELVDWQMTKQEFPVFPYLITSSTPPLTWEQAASINGGYWDD